MTVVLDSITFHDEIQRKKIGKVCNSKIADFRRKAQLFYAGQNLRFCAFNCAFV